MTHFFKLIVLYVKFHNIVMNILYNICIVYGHERKHFLVFWLFPLSGYIFHISATNSL